MTVSEVSTTTPVTRPPILDETGQAIAAAIRGLKNTDPTLSVLGKPADALIVGNEIERLEKLIETTGLYCESTALVDLYNIIKVDLQIGGFSHRNNGVASSTNADFHTSCKRTGIYYRYKFPKGTIILTNKNFDIEIFAFKNYNEAYSAAYDQSKYLRTTTNYYIIDNDEDSSYFYKIDILHHNTEKSSGPYIDLTDTNIQLYFISPEPVYSYYWYDKDKTIPYKQELSVLEKLITIDEDNEKINIRI